MGPEPLALPVTVAVVEDQPVTVDGVRYWSERDELRRTVVIDSASSLDELLAGPGGQADVLLLDLDLNGIRITDRIAELCAGGRRVVVFSVLTDTETIHTVHASGAASFLGKHETPDHLIEAIVAAAHDEPYVAPSVAGAIVTDPATVAQLSEQEQTALLLWFQGLPKKSVARRMGVKESTVRQYIQRARRKYAAVGRSANTQAELAIETMRDGYFRPEDIP